MVSFYLLSFFFPCPISAAVHWMSTILPHMVYGLSANFECRSEMCYTRFAENTGRKKSPKISIWAPSHNFVGLYLRKKARIDNRKKNSLSSSMSSRCPHNMVNFGPLTVEIGSGVWGTPANFNGFRVLAALLHGSQVVNSISQTLRR